MIVEKDHISFDNLLLVCQDCYLEFVNNSHSILIDNNCINTLNIEHNINHSNRINP